MSNLEVVKDLLFQAGALIEMHYAGLMTTNETLLSVIEIIEKAVDAHAEGGTIKVGEIDKNTGLRIEQGWVNDDEETGKICPVAREREIDWRHDMRNIRRGK
jgi:hypothetical protein